MLHTKFWEEEEVNARRTTHWMALFLRFAKIDPVDLEKRIYKYCQSIFAFSLLSHTGKVCNLHLNKIEFHWNKLNGFWKEDEMVGKFTDIRMDNMWSENSLDNVFNFWPTPLFIVMCSINVFLLKKNPKNIWEISTLNPLI